MKSQLRLLSVVLVLLVCCAALPVLADESMHLIEPNLANTPKDTFGTPPSEWDNKGLDTFGTPPSEWYSTWKSNPALLNLQENYYFIASMFFKGSYTDFENEMTNALAGGYNSWSESGEKVVGNSTGTDIGFLVRFNDISSFGGLVHYRYDNMLGYGDFDMSHTELGVGGPGSMVISGETARRSDAHTEGLTLLYDMDVSDVFSMGMGLTYLYTYENMNYDVNGTTTTLVLLAIPEDVKIDREYIFNTHTLSPSIGFSITPTDRFTLNLSGSVDFYLGTMEKKSRMYDSYYINNGTLPAGTTYSERLDDGDIEGYGYNAEADTEIFLTDELSLTYLASGSYTDRSWDIDGVTNGFFAPYGYFGIYHGPGSITYENDEKTWHATGGAGLNYALARVTLNSLITYTHWENKTSYLENNNAVDWAVGPYNAWFEERTKEDLDIISLKLGATAHVTDDITFDLGVGYGFGWGDYRYNVSSNSPLSLGELTFGGSDGDTFHDLSAGGSLTYSPFDRLNISLSGSGKFPLDKKAYNLSGTSAGGGAAISPLAWGGAGSRGYESTGFTYGGNFFIGYEF